jgi:cytochrome b561
VKDTPLALVVSQRYTKPAIILHWAIAALLLANLTVGFLFDYVPKDALRPLIDTHKSFGITVIGLGVLRLLWRATHTPPPMPAYAPWERRAAHAVHWLLYGFIFLVPLSGWLHDSAWKLAPTHPMKLYWVIPWFRFGFIEQLDPVTKEHWHSVLFVIHAYLAYALAGAFVFHVAGALKHQFIDGKPELQRMWPAK